MILYRANLKRAAWTQPNGTRNITCYGMLHIHMLLYIIIIHYFQLNIRYIQILKQYFGCIHEWYFHRKYKVWKTYGCVAHHLGWAFLIPLWPEFLRLWMWESVSEGNCDCLLQRLKNLIFCNKWRTEKLKRGGGEYWEKNILFSWNP